MDQYATSPVYDDLQTAVIRYAGRMTEDVALGDAAFQAVGRRLGERELVELSLTVALANFTNRLNETFQTDLES